MTDRPAKNTLPEPRCRLGYPSSQVREIMCSDQEFAHFQKWMVGQTLTGCNGYSYNHETEQYVRTCEAEEWPGGGHGPVYYTHDVYRFMLGLPVID